MSFLEIARLVGILGSILVILLGAALLLVGPEKLEGLFGEKELPEVDFATLVRDDRPNSWLVCPPGACPLADADATAPVFDMPVETLRTRMLELIEIGGDARLRSVDMERQQFGFVVRTPTMRFPDVVTVRFYPAGEGSTLAILSRSIYGWSDIGANRRRVERWLAILGASES